MKILATIFIRGRPVTQPWDYVQGDPEPVIVLTNLADGRLLGIPLDANQIEESHSQGAAKSYLGNLDVSQAILIPRV